jgi:hypothetical protein
VNLDNEGGVVLTVTGESSRNYAIEASGDLKNWTQIGVKAATTGEVVFSEPATSAIRFYRAVIVSEEW